MRNPNTITGFTRIEMERGAMFDTTQGEYFDSMLILVFCTQNDATHL